MVNYARENSLKIIEAWGDLPKLGKGKALIMMSGGGSNAEKILESRERYKGLEIVGIFTDSRESRAQELSNRFNILCITEAVESFASKDERKIYFDLLESKFREMGINLLIYAGFMKITTPSFATAFPGINSHPADLLVVDDSGKPKYVGMPVIEMAIKDGQKSICASCCAVVNPVDSGLVISQSRRISVSESDLNDIKAVHERLKLEEWEYYPKTIEMLCSGEINASKLPYLFE